MLEELALGRIVFDHHTLLPIQPCYDYIVQLVMRGVQSDDERPSLLQMLFQVLPLPPKDESAEPVLLEIALHRGGGDPVRRVRMEGLLYLFRVIICWVSLLALPVLHDHGNTCGATAVLFLFYERNIQPNSRLLSGKKHSAGKKQHRKSQDRVKHARVLTDGNDDQDQSRDEDENEEEVAIRKITGRKIGLRLFGT